MNTFIETTWDHLHHVAFTAQFLDAWLKSLAVLAAAGLLSLLCRRAAAATRHWIWFLALASLPCLLLLSAAPHPWQRPLWSISTSFNSGNQFSLALNLAAANAAANSTPRISTPAATALNPSTSRSNQPLAARFSTAWVALAFTIWLIGAALGLISIGAGQVQLRCLARRARLIATTSRASNDPPAFLNGASSECHPQRLEYEFSQPQNSDWAPLLQEASETLGLRQSVRLLQSADNPIPLTWGACRPVVLLPADAANWPKERRRVVLLHELAHVKRWDCLTQSVARIICALYWINPLAWLATRRMCVERELACDDLVLNSGCKASEYATHLVDIARTFRRVPQLAGIAMARSSQLQGRIAAIVDASRARQLRPLTIAAILILMSALVLSVGWSSPDASPNPAQDSALRQQQIAKLQSFAQAKAKQSQDLAAKAGEQLSPEFQSFFDAATKGDWQTVTNRYAFYKEHHPQYTKGTNGMEVQLRTAYWQPVLEICLAYDQVANCEPKYTEILAHGLIDSIPAGSIYFGGTDPGRGVPTAFSKSHTDGDPFFTITQNALADGTYLEYLRSMYGGKIYTPTGEDSQNCFQEYMADAQRRLAEGKLRPGEDVRKSENRVMVSGQVAVMSINGLLTKLIFDHNPDREFYVEESFPLDWMFPYAEPHGLIMKLNRQPLAQLPEATLAQDHAYWSKLVDGMLGDWLDEKTTVREIAEFIDHVYVRHDLKGFTGDPEFIQNDYAKKLFSKLRSSIGGHYAWRVNPPTPSEYRPKTTTEYQKLLKEADFAFRQAFALCPYSPEALFRYVQLLLQLQHFDDAILATESCLKLDPSNGQVKGLLENIKSYKTQSAGMGQTQITLDQMEAAVRNNPTNAQAALDLAGAHLQLQQTNRALQILDNLLNNPRVDAKGVLGVAQAYARMSNTPKLESALERLVKVTPDNPEAWYDLAALKASLKKPSEALAALKQALELSAARLQLDPKARDLRESVRKDPRFDPLRQAPEFEKLIGQ